MARGCWMSISSVLANTLNAPLIYGCNVQGCHGSSIIQKLAGTYLLCQKQPSILYVFSHPVKSCDSRTFHSDSNTYTSRLIHAEGQPIEDMPAEQSEMAREILTWAATGVHIFLHSNNSQASFTKTIWWWKNTARVEQAFRDALPDTYKKVLGFLEAQYGSVSYLYDRCPSCPLIYRSRFKDHEQCPRCLSRGKDSQRFIGEGQSRRPAAVLIYNPMAEYVRHLWSNPDTAR